MATINHRNPDVSPNVNLEINDNTILEVRIGQADVCEAMQSTGIDVTSESATKANKAIIAAFQDLEEKSFWEYLVRNFLAKEFGVSIASIATDGDDCLPHHS